MYALLFLPCLETAQPTRLCEGRAMIQGEERRSERGPEWRRAAG